MLDYNTNSSTIKGNKDTEGTFDYWYYTNIEQKGYNSKIEDIIWCNNRKISYLGGFDPNGGVYHDELWYSSVDTMLNFNTPSLSCERDIDKFTVSKNNGNGDLDYPIGLLTTDEMMLAGAVLYFYAQNTNFYLYDSEISFWSMTPWDSTNSSSIVIMHLGTLYISEASTVVGIRPSISLKPGTKISSGDGTVNNPYTIITE